MKSREQIAAETRGKPLEKRHFQPSANYEYGKKITEWDASLPATSQLSRDDFIRRVEPMRDRILVQLLETEQRMSSIVLTDPKPLIGGMRKAVVLKTGPGKWVEGEWWKVRKKGNQFVYPPSHPRAWQVVDEAYEWEWLPGHRRPVSVSTNQIVLIGNWVDLECEDIALCQEMDVRGVLPEAAHSL
jgi:co-chaperonin GroES (HSP10)